MAAAAIKSLADALKDEKTDNSDAGKVFNAAREIHAELASIQVLHDPRELILAAKTLTNKANDFVTKAIALGAKARNAKSKDVLESNALQVKHWAVQIKMLLAVRAAGSAADVSKTATEEDQYTNSVKGIVDSIIAVLDHETLGDAEEELFKSEPKIWVSPWAKK